MELWIRSQDKKVLTICNYFDVNDEGEIIIYDGCPIAKYKTKERALEVLDEIEELDTNNKNIIVSKHFGNLIKITYEMPKE